VNLAIGVRVRTILELVTEDGAVLRPGTLATVVGFEGERLILSFEEGRTAIVQPWEVRRVPS
jgi:hypothetical protein